MNPDRVDLSNERNVAEAAARAAGAILTELYARGPIAVDLKADESPVTEADRAANAAIVGVLRAAFPDDALLSEELPDDPARLTSRRVWIVDPLDGTRDFVARTGDFCVHVALAIDGVAAVGAVFQPSLAALFSAAAGAGATVERDGTRHPLHVSPLAARADLRVGRSRMSPGARLGRCLTETGLDARAVTMGASTKHMQLALGNLEAVINFNTAEHEWDTCAPEIVVREAGGRVTDADGNPLRYNQRDLHRRRGSVVTNGACHDLVLQLIRPYLEPEGDLSA